MKPIGRISLSVALGALLRAQSVGEIVEVAWSPSQTPPATATVRSGGRDYIAAVVQTAATLDPGTPGLRRRVVHRVGVLIPEMPPGPAVAQVGGLAWNIDVSPSFSRQIIRGEDDFECTYPAFESSSLSPFWRGLTADALKKGSFQKFKGGQQEFPAVEQRFREVHGADGMTTLVSKKSWMAAEIRRTDAPRLDPIPNSALRSTVYSGDIERRFDLLIMGDGFGVYTKDGRHYNEEPIFHRKAQELIDRLRTFAPFSEKFAAFNIWTMFIPSKQTGIANEPRGMRDVDSALGVQFYGTRILDFKNGRRRVCDTIAHWGLRPDGVMILVNDYQAAGGSANGFTFVTISSDMGPIATHELGHLIGDLADEYDCFPCSPGHDEAPDDDVHREVPRVNRPNISRDPNFEKKWARDEVGQQKWPAVDYGPYEGAGGRKQGYYRPADQCHMRTRAAPFCKHCLQVLREELDEYLK